MYTFVLGFNMTLFFLFTLCYLYQIIYVFVVFKRKPAKLIAQRNHRYAVLISGRNESTCIGNLIDSINHQNYPSELVHTFVIADNCTDDTAEIARSHGATVFERFDQNLVGKSWALDYGIHRIFDEYGTDAFEGFFVFDADNVLDSNFIAEMNKSFDNGSRIVTSYRNSKNFGSSWISSGYALWFLREGKYLSQARSVLGNSCAISGTGFLVRTDILVRDGGWSHHLLTEDIEFSIDSICKGDRIDYAPNAIVYDEQPITFAQSWNQRLRWSRGFYQVFLNYGGRLLRGIRNRDFSSYDMMMTIAPGMLITIASLIANTTFFIISICDTSLTSQITEASVQAMFFSVFNFYLCLFCFGLLTSITERKQIHATRWQRIRAVVTFPVFMLTYAPIAVVALFKKVEWKPIAHTVSVTAQEITGQAAEPRRLER